MSNRKINIDILKTIGLFLIMLAHVTPPTLIFNIRNFDVTLMMLVSAYLGLNSYRDDKYLKYVIKRFKRLIIPTWIFLTFFFILDYRFQLGYINNKVIFDSFNLTGGIGYVWIIRIYFIVALLVPICKKQLNYNKTILPTVILMIVLQELLCYVGLFENIIIRNMAGFILPCYTLIIISYYLFESNNKKTLLLTSISLIIYLSYIVYFYIVTNTIPAIQVYKYPFRLYYLSYGVFVSGILILVLNNKKVCNFINNKLMYFISKESLTIYFWHILAVYILKKFDLEWYFRYSIIIISSVLMSFIQYIVLKIFKKTINKLFHLLYV